MRQDTRVWLHGLIAGAVTTLGTAGSAAITMPDVFNFSEHGLANMAKIILVPIFMSVFAYLKQSPIPGPSISISSEKKPDGTTTVTATKTE